MKKFPLITTILITSSLLFAAGCADTTRQDQATIEQDRPVAQSDRSINDTNQNTVSNTDRDFVIDTARDGMAEVEIGKLASKKATNAEVKQFAQQMVQDHTKANNELQGLAQAKKIELPQDMGDENKEDLEKLSNLSGTKFDQTYMKLMTKAHKKDISAFERQAQQGDDQDLKTWAASTLPTLQQHQELANAITDNDTMNK